MTSQRSPAPSQVCLFLPALGSPTSSAAPFYASGFALVWIPVYTSLFLEMYLYICTPADLQTTPRPLVTSSGFKFTLH